MKRLRKVAWSRRWWQRWLPWWLTCWFFGAADLDALDVALRGAEESLNQVERLQGLETAAREINELCEQHEQMNAALVEQLRLEVERRKEFSRTMVKAMHPEDAREVAKLAGTLKTDGLADEMEAKAKELLDSRSELQLKPVDPWEAMQILKQPGAVAEPAGSPKTIADIPRKDARGKTVRGPQPKKEARP